MGVCHSPQHDLPGATQRTARWLPQSLQVPRDTFFLAHRQCSPWCCPGIVHVMHVAIGGAAAAAAAAAVAAVAAAALQMRPLSRGLTLLV